MYENLPFWFQFFTSLNFEVVLSEESSRNLYVKGQRTIPSDTVCYPAKLAHGHIMSLLDKHVDYIFYPCMPYNFDEGISDNNYNCPVVAYYPELLAANIPGLKQTRFLTPYMGLHRPKDCKSTAVRAISARRWASTFPKWVLLWIWPIRPMKNGTAALFPPGSG